MFNRLRPSHSEAVAGIEHRLPGKTAHLPAQGACLKGDAVVSVINQHVELRGRRRRCCFIGDRDMFGQIGFTAQTAVGGVLAFLMDLRGLGPLAAGAADGLTIRRPRPEPAFRPAAAAAAHAP
jgi:hypothetical protein